MHRLWALLATSLLVSCGSARQPVVVEVAATAPTTDMSAPTTSVPDAAPPPPPAPAIVERPYRAYVPATYDPAAPSALVLALHGLGGNSSNMQQYLQFEPLAERFGFLYVVPDGTHNESGHQFWNATDACCGGDSEVDDAAYLLAIIDDMKATYNVDAQRVYIIGLSNGGFMAYRMACGHADTLAAIISVAGATFRDPRDCAPSSPVSVLQVHGTADSVISFDGGVFMGTSPYPSALDSTATWATYNDCVLGQHRNSLGSVDYEPTVAGAETDIYDHGACAAGTAVQLWQMNDAGHIPTVTPTLTTAFVDFLFAHPKP